MRTPRFVQDVHANNLQVIGIECVGVVEACPSGNFKSGQKVAAFMGGLGRTINGSYAEYTSAPETNVVAFESNLPWTEVAAVPEVFATVWTCLFRNLELKSGQTILIRGATSAMGQAAVKLAIAAGAQPIATVRSRDRFAMIEALGVTRCVEEGPTLSKTLPEAGEIDAVLDLVGNSTVVDSLNIPQRYGRVCIAGWLGGLAPVKDFDPLMQVKSGVQLSLFASPHFGLPEYPVSDIPLGDILADIQAGEFSAKAVKVFSFDQIREAHEFMEKSGVPGKVVVSVE